MHILQICQHAEERSAANSSMLPFISSILEAAIASQCVKTVNSAESKRARLPTKRKEKPLGANKLFISEPDFPISFSLRPFNTELSFFESSLAGGVEG